MPQNKATKNNEQHYTARIGTGVASIATLMRPVRAESHAVINDVYETIPEGTPPEEQLAQASKGGKLNRRLAAMTAAVLPMMVTRDNWMKKYTEQEYNASWYEHNYALDYTADADIPLGNPSKKLRTERFNHQNNKLANSEALSLSRRATAAKMRQSIVSSLNQGQTLRQATRAMDVVLGFRTPQGELTDLAIRQLQQGKLTIRGGEIYNSTRVLRTEMSRMHAWANVDAMKKAQDKGVEERLQKGAVIDTRTRPQSASMDGQISDEDGRFLYPNNIRYYMGQQPARWAINDRGFSIPYVIDVPPEFRTPESNRYFTFQEWAKENDVRINIYGQRYSA